MNREEKARVIQELNEKFTKARFAVVTDYRGLTVPVFEGLRKELKQNNAEIRVAKNTLLRRAIKRTAFEEMFDYLKGSTAITIAEGDPVAPAKAVVEFIADHPQLAIKTAILDGQILTEADLTALSRLPGREVLLAKLLSVMQAVPTNFVQVLNGVPRKMVCLLTALKDQKEQIAQSTN